MSLVILCGPPCSGKTSCCKDLSAHFPVGKVVRVCPDKPPGVCYGSSEEEKMCRAELLSNVTKQLCKDHIVVVDDLNLIKGFRYQLYCQAKEAQIPSCVLYCSKSYMQHAELNGWQSKEQAQQVANRLEVPKANARWDKPLFCNVKQVIEWIESNHKQRKQHHHRKPEPLVQPNESTANDESVGIQNVHQLIQEEMMQMLNNDDALSMAVLRKHKRQYLKAAGTKATVQGFKTYVNESV